MITWPTEQILVELDGTKSGLFKAFIQARLFLWFTNGKRKKETAVPGTERFLQPETQHDFTIVYVSILKGRLLCLHLPPKDHRACALRTVPQLSRKGLLIVRRMRKRRRDETVEMERLPTVVQSSNSSSSTELYRSVKLD